MRRLLVFALAGLVGSTRRRGPRHGLRGHLEHRPALQRLLPAASSASVHLAEIGTTFTSGLAHWRFGNVSWPLVRAHRPARCGRRLRGCHRAHARSRATGSRPPSPWSCSASAALVIVRSVRGDLHGERHDPGHLRRRLLAPLGLSAGFIDAVGGGGGARSPPPRCWPRAGSSPGSSSARCRPPSCWSPCPPAWASCSGSAARASRRRSSWRSWPVAWSPPRFAAWLVRHADASVLGVVIGTLLLITNARVLMLEVGVPGPVRLVVILA